MGAYRHEHWPGNPTAPRVADRRPGRFAAYIPHPISEWQPTLPADLVAYMAGAEQMLTAGAGSASHTPADTPGLFFWAESLGSSRIEGIHAPARKVVHAMLSESTPSPLYRRGAVGEALGNIDAVRQAQQALADPSTLTVDSIREAHTALMTSTPAPGLGGVIKTTQNWIGGNDWHPLDGDFVPPPPDTTNLLLDDLVRYLRSSSHTPMLKAALSHAQFETIHPFGDGNGRTGRAILYAVLKHDCASDGFMPPVSLALSHSRESYMDALRAFQSYVGTPDDPRRSQALCHIVETVSVASRRACEAVAAYADAVERIQEIWLNRVARRRERSAASAAVSLLSSRPALTPEVLAEASGYSRKRCASALLRLDEAGITRRHTISPRLRVHEAKTIFALYETMAATIGDPSAATERYDDIVATAATSAPAPTAPSQRPSNPAQPRNSASRQSRWKPCPKRVASTGMPCGLEAGHRGHCRTIVQRKQPPRRQHRR